MESMEEETGKMNAKIDVSLDLRGEVCPWPASYSLARLKGMKSGEILQVVADGMCAVDGIPAALAQAGHKLFQTETIGDGVYRFTIQVV